LAVDLANGFGAFILVAAFVWIVFDNLALGLIVGLMAAAAASKAVSTSPPANDETGPLAGDPH
jgi:MFS superfamily sulfate permease-like transporter